MQSKITTALAAAALLGGVTLASEAVALPGLGTGSAIDRSGSPVEQARSRGGATRQFNRMNRAFNRAVAQSVRPRSVRQTRQAKPRGSATGRLKRMQSAFSRAIERSARVTQKTTEHKTKVDAAKQRPPR
jgi:hypothetical protein